MDALPGLWSLTPIGALLGGIVLFYWLLATGRIITKGSHEREIALVRERGDDWRDSTLDSRAVSRELLKQNGQLLEGSKISDHFFSVVKPKEVTSDDVA